MLSAEDVIDYQFEGLEEVSRSRGGLKEAKHGAQKLKEMKPGFSRL